MDAPVLWDTTQAPAAFDPVDWHAHSAALGRPAPRLPPLAVLTVMPVHAAPSDGAAATVPGGSATGQLGAAGHPYRLLERQGRAIVVVGTAKGSAAAGVLDEILALGVQVVIFAGGCGALVDDLAPGTLVAPTAALRDEGVSHHYAPPGRWALAHPTLAACLEARPVRTWTTGAHFRQTLPRLSAFRAEGCSVVENEAASLFAVGRFRGAAIAAVAAVGDSIASGRFTAPATDTDPAPALLSAATAALARYADAGHSRGSA